MSAYIKISTGEYYFYEGDIRLEYPQMGKEFVCPPEYAPVKRTPPPVFDDMLENIIAEPKLIDGEWMVTYQVVPLPAEKIAELQAQRDKALGLLMGTTGSGSAPNVID